MRRVRLPSMAAIGLAVLVTVLAVPHADLHGATTAGSHSRHTFVAARTVAAQTVADVTTTGGICSVPGIGDIGGLLGFCSLGSSGLLGDLNNICEPSLPDPEPANGGINAMVAPPVSGKQLGTLYDEYGVAGDYWAATGLQCSDMTSLIGNNVAGMVFDVAKSIDRVTITVYQSAAGNGLLGWLQRVTDKLITSLGNAIYFPYLAVVIILGAIWLAWQGLIRKRGTRTIEGTLWMVAACVAAIVLIGKPADVTGIGKGVSDGMSQALNAAFAKLPSPGPTSCVPVQKGDPQSQPATYSYTSGGTVVDQNADELWTVLVCKPWLDGEFGTSVYSAGGAKPTIVNTYGRSLLWAQAIAGNEKPTAALMQAKQSAYAGIASSIQANDPAIYPLFQGKQWTTRLEIAFAALFAAVVAGVLVLLIAVTLILLKLGFLLLLIVGPFFLLIGTHPGFGRIVAIRWVELLIGVLIKQAALAVVLSVLLYCYALIMGTSDAVLPWALKILMIALVSVAAFIYRKPFQHLFSAVGYGVIGSHEAAAADLQRAGATARANTSTAATLAVPPFAAYRAGRWARRNPAQAASLALGVNSGSAAGVAAGVAGVAGGEAGQTADGAVAADGTASAGGSVTDVAAGAAGRAALAARVRDRGEADGQPVAEAPPLKLPARNGAAGPSAPAFSADRGVAPPLVGPASPSRSASGNGGAPRSGSSRAWPTGRGYSGSRSGTARGGTSQSASRPSSGAGGGGSGRASSPPPIIRKSPPTGTAGPARPASPGRLARAAPAGSGRAARSRGTSGSQAAGRSASLPSVRRDGPWAGRDGPPPPRQRDRQARNSGAASRRRDESDAPATWQGQSVAGPLANRSRDPASERAVPFWLRPLRRK